MYVIERWNDSECAAFLRSQVVHFNAGCLSDQIKTPVEQMNLLIQDESGHKVGGLSGEIYWHHLHIDFLWIEEDSRGKGFGRQLLQMAEKRAREKDCRLILLDTFSFQAPEFYKKQGFNEFGVVRDHPAGFSQHFFEKRLGLEDQSSEELDETLPASVKWNK